MAEVGFFDIKTIECLNRELNVKTAEYRKLGKSGAHEEENDEAEPQRKRDAKSKDKR